MKTYVLPSLKLAVVLIVLCAIAYPALILAVARIGPAKGEGETIVYQGKVRGYKDIGQQFTDDKYFWGRPSFVDYNAAASGGSNKAPGNPEYLALVQQRVDSFLVHNPGVRRSAIPVELVTASGSGLDPDISVQAARVQVRRIARIRNKNEKELYRVIDKVTEAPFLGIFGPEKVNVLKLNIAMDNL